MKNKKVLLCGLLALVILFVAASCNGTTEGTAEETENGYGQVTQNEESVQVSASESDFDVENFSFSDGIDENGMWQGVRALNYVEIFNYRAMPIPAETHQVTQESIQEIIDNILTENILRVNTMDREVAHGDTINIDFVGSVDGVEFDGGSTGGAGMDVTIGVTQFIDDFLYQLIGHTPGSTVNVEVTFPDEYPQQPALEGAEALFVTTINHIVEEIKPELTDAFVAENFAELLDLNTVDELTEHIRDFLHTNAVQQYIYEYIITNVVVTSIPQELIRYHEQLTLRRNTDQAAQFGMDLDAMLSMFGFSDIEAFLEANREDIETEARFSLILQAVAEDANISVNVQDVTDFFIENFDTEDFSEFEEMHGLPWLKQVIRNQRVMEFISENAELL